MMGDVEQNEKSNASQSSTPGRGQVVSSHSNHNSLSPDASGAHKEGFETERSYPPRDLERGEDDDEDKTSDKDANLVRDDDDAQRRNLS